MKEVNKPLKVDNSPSYVILGGQRKEAHMPHLTPGMKAAIRMSVVSSNGNTVYSPRGSTPSMAKRLQEAGLQTVNELGQRLLTPEAIALRTQLKG